MAWVTVPGLNGKVFIPDSESQKDKKYPCKGCFSCQMCCEDRCHVCRHGGSKRMETRLKNGCCNSA